MWNRGQGNNIEYITIGTMVCSGNVVWLWVCVRASLPVCIEHGYLNKVRQMLCLICCHWRVAVIHCWAQSGTNRPAGSGTVGLMRAEYVTLPLKWQIILYLLGPITEHDYAGITWLRPLRNRRWNLYIAWQSI